ncbi:glycosyltransferase [Gloeocapsopsis dulcis]|uniref:Glycoside hydrolase n=1 Tax=Gloeocapsopsis dulcis AAB1 = 1H9 TaxID=1433147 RepID=A0A6N8G194_9CHRO|nr:glycosyltransferase [Gloeocapsopsis dulcis]MUL38754.1 glycoside hydrolase [Gloeocapsopsis dulcis AAB1 = 1H9]WNN91668.1 glycosyltransferase [Gloeocapsopsis dulcis]
MRKPVLTIFYQFNPWHSTIGGVQTVVSNFIKYAPDEFEVRLVGTSNDPAQPNGKWQEAELAGRKLQFMPLFTLQNDNFRSLVPTTLKYTAALIGHCFASDFMHFHRLEPSLATLHWSGDKTLFIHNDIQKQMQSQENANAILWRRFPQAYFQLESLLVKQFNQILSCNSESVKLYQQKYPTIADRVAFIKNTVDSQTFCPLSLEEQQEKRVALTQKLELPANTQFILFAGRLHPQKDPLLLVRAISALTDLNVHLLIAGDGELATDVRLEVERLGLSKRITMLGSVIQAELTKLHQATNVFVLSSAYEGLPLVVLEALACGTPVVTTNCGEISKLLPANCGVICEERTPVAVADALRQVLLHAENYPIEACVRATEPYSASTVVGAVYSDMWHRWKQQNLVSTVQKCSTNFT